MNNLIFILTLLTALGSGLIAGAFFAFSSFVMGALGRIPSAEGLRGMQSINIVVINPVFLGVFIGTAVLCVGLALLSALNWSAPGSAWLIAGCALYVVGCFGVTVAFNIPLNDALAAADPATAEGLKVWENYLNVWTTWNTVRTIASAAALVTFIVGLSYKNS